MQDIDCPFRHDVRTEGDVEVAVCGLVKKLTELPAEHCKVSRSACVVCCRSLTDRLVGANDVLTSIFHSATSAATKDLKEPLPDRVRHIRQVASQIVCGEDAYPVTTLRCDVVIFCEDSSDATDRAIRSVLEQQDVIPLLHLCGRVEAGELLEKYSRHADVVVHPVREQRSVYDVIHDLIPSLHTQFVAVQDARSVSRGDRLKCSLAAMHDHGLDIVGCAVKTPNGTIEPQQPSTHSERFVASEGLLFRRASLIDMGGFCQCRNADIELLLRAVTEGRKIGLLPDVLVESNTVSVEQIRSRDSNYYKLEEPQSTFGRGFPQSTVACDVVLPFFGQLSFVEEAIRSILEQENADVVIHLIDDASVEDTSHFMSRWKQHTNVRAYRNRKNIGQFSSFNNAYPFLETNLVAVQDGDDISFSNRLHTAGNALGLADADLFGAATMLFGKTRIAIPGESFAREEVEAPSCRESHYPSRTKSDYYLMNPTTVIRKPAFGELGGFGDFGDRLRNRTGLDTEFQIRANLAGARIAVSKKALVKYRVHAESATQDTISGWGTTPRTEAQLEIERRRRAYRRGRFDPKAFGALRKFVGVTERI